MIKQLFSGYAGPLNLIFLILFLTSFFLLILNLNRRNYLKAYLFLFLTFPFVTKLPLLITTFETDMYTFKVYEGLSFNSISLIIFLFFLNKNADFKTIFKFLRKEKVVILVLFCTISFSVSQQYNSFSSIGFLYGITEIIEPFIISLITAFVFYLNRNNFPKLISYLNISLLYALLFTFGSGLLFQEVGGVTRLGGGAIGNATIAGTIFASFSIINFYIYLFYKKSLQFFLWFALFIFLTVATQSRGPLIEISLGFFLIFIKARRTIKIKLIKTLLLSFSILVLPFINVLINIFINRNFSISAISSDDSWLTRIIRNKVAIDKIIESPLLGIGFASPDTGLTKGDPFFEVYFHIYNTPLAWFTYGGIICGICFIIINIKLYKYSVHKRNFKSNNDILRSLFHILLLMWFVDYFTTGNMLLFGGYPFSIIVYFFMLIGFILGDYYYIISQDHLVHKCNVDNKVLISN